MDREVTLAEMLEARERRALRQSELLRETGTPLISFTLNTAGPVKNGPALRRVFREGLERLEDALAAERAAILRRELLDGPAGCEALLSVAGDGAALKALCAGIEDRHPLGRLFDMDVLGPGGEKLDREALGLPPRGCLICGRPGKSCASRRLHPVEQLQARTRELIRAFFAQKDAQALAAQAQRALLYEVCATPKPGLVDRANTGSHRDMDIFTFVDSTTALLPYLERAARLGMDTADRPPEDCFPLLRREGLAAERAMYAATGGVNTHKGAIFTLGTAVCAAGRLWRPERPWAPAEEILAQCGRLYAREAGRDLAALRSGGADTAGGRLCRERGLAGIREELAEGLPAVRDTGLPALRRALKAGAGLEQAGLAALIRLMAAVTDTNLLARGGEEALRWAAGEAAALEEPVPSRQALKRLDREMIRQGLSPGGCADLLAITYFLHFLSLSGS